MELHPFQLTPAGVFSEVSCVKDGTDDDASVEEVEQSDEEDGVKTVSGFEMSSLDT
jgi:hypothetical protein